MSLDAAEPGLEKLVFLHYPPVYTGTSAPEIVATLRAYGIRTCYYGHLHGNAIRYAVQGDVAGGRDQNGRNDKKSKFGVAILSRPCYNKL